MERIRQIRTLMAACVLVIIVATTGCGQTVGPLTKAAEAGAQSRIAPATVISALKRAILAAEAGFPDSPQQWSWAVDDGLRPPSPLLRELKRVPKTGLTAAETKVVNEANAWASAYESVDNALARVEGLSLGLPSDAIRLVSLSRIRSGGKAFDDHVDQIAMRLLKKQSCAVGRSYIDAATADYVDGQGSDAVSDIVDSFLIQNEISQELSSSWDASEQFVDMEQLADQIVAEAKRYAPGYVEVLESPNGNVAVANLAYLRVCLSR